MKAHTNDFKNEIKKFGREISSKVFHYFNFSLITENDNSLITENGLNLVTEQFNENDKEQILEENINQIRIVQDGQLLKSLMKVVELETKHDIDIKDVIRVNFGILVNENYEYLDYGNYIVYKKTYNASNKAWNYVCYDMMLYSMIQYKRLNISYPINVRNYLKAIANKMGINFANENDNFTNYNQIIVKDYFQDKNVTLRDILDFLSQTTASVICINNNDELEVRYTNVAGTYQTVQGTDLYLENVDDEENFNLELKGNIIQNGTPSPDGAREIETVTGNQEIDIIGKNLFDVDGNVSQGTRVKYGDYGLTFTKNVNRVCRIDLPIVMPSGTYTISMDKVNSTLSGDNKLSIGIMLYASSVQTIQPLVNGTFTTISSFNQLYFFINNDQSDSATITIDNIQLEKGSNATSFESCKANIYEIDLDDIELCKIGDYQDKIYKDNGKWYLYKEIGKTLLNGTQNITRRNNGDGSTTLSFNVISDVLILLPGSTYSNRFVYSQSSTDGNEGFGYASGNIYVEIKRNRLSDISTTTKQVESMTEWLSNNNTTFYYILETPITIEITNEELINQLESIRLLTGTNIIMTDYHSPIKLTYLSEIETIDEEMLKDINVNFGEKYGPINKISLVDSENNIEYTSQNDISIEKNNLIEIKINDNPITLNGDIETICNNILKRLSGIYYSINDFNSTGICYFDYLDVFKVSIEGNEYKCLLLNDEIEITQGLQETIYSDHLNNSNTETNNYETNNWTNKEVQQKIVQLSDTKVGNKNVVSSINSSNELIIVDTNKIMNRKTISGITDSDGFLDIQVDNKYIILSATAQFSSNDYGFIIPYYYYNNGSPKWLLKIENKNKTSLANTEITVIVYYAKIKEEYEWQI